MIQHRDTWEYGYATNKGPKKVNEDRCWVRTGTDKNKNEFALGLVADGMGGYQAGDYASELVLSVIEDWWNTRIPELMKGRNPLPQISIELDRVLHRINEQLLHRKQINGTTPGTTISLIFFHNRRYMVKHVGDSRIYKLSQSRGEYWTTQGSLEETAPLHLDLMETEPLNNASFGSLNQLTEDHSWVELQVKQGFLTKEQARRHHKRNVILQCLGIEKKLDIFQTAGEYVRE